MTNKKPIPLNEVFDASGGIPALARKLKISRHAIYQWPKVPIGRVNMVAKITGIPCEQLRPDIFSKIGAA